MGQLRGWDPAWSAAHDVAEPIGAAARQTACSACRTQRVGGEVVFGDEEPVMVHVRWRPLEDDCEQGLWRMELKVPERAGVEDPGPRAGDTLLCAEYPRANGWLACTTFKRGERHGREGGAYVQTRTNEPLTETVGRRERDPWEQGKWLTAAVDGGPEHSLLVTPRLRSFSRDAYWLFGVCTAFVELRDAVIHGERGRELLSLTQSGQLRTTAPRGRGQGAVRESRAVHPRVVEEASHLWLVAVSQALAGPADNERPPKGSASWVGVPVHVLAERIYLSHLDNASRRHQREGAKLRFGDDYDF